MAKSRRTPNDQRSDAHNPTSKEYKDRMDHNSELSNSNSSAFKDDADNRSRQLDRNNPSNLKNRPKS